MIQNREERRKKGQEMEKKTSHPFVFILRKKNIRTEEHDLSAIRETTLNRGFCGAEEVQHDTKERRKEEEEMEKKTLQPFVFIPATLHILNDKKPFAPYP